ncbi:aminoglycoside phosphotransferase family protein [Streptomyces sp. NPDC001904]|uniref:aminoglycoside phosphotransferase family protein n=1 Tax=Streptomyces sp. NPDC001904 TaxID=3154531 RepID=UPI0033226890
MAVQETPVSASFPARPIEGSALEDSQWAALMTYAANKGAVMEGHHNTNRVVVLPPAMAGWFGGRLETPALVTVRARKPKALPVVIRMWQDESTVLDAIGLVLENVPRCLARRDDVAVHSYVQGVPLSLTCPTGEFLEPEMVRALAGELARMTRVRVDRLPPLPAAWSRLSQLLGQSAEFLRTLALAADTQIRQPNWAVFGGLFASLGVAERALIGLAERVPKLHDRPFSLLHGDLHRDNVIVAFDRPKRPLICVDWELALYGDPLHDLATHLVRMRYPRKQWDEVIEAWCRAMKEEGREQATDGVTSDLPHYVDFERAQSVYPDVMRAVSGLGSSFGPGDLELAALEVHRALEAAERPLRLRGLPRTSTIEQLILRWCKGRGARFLEKEPGARWTWERDERVPLRAEFGEEMVEEALWAEALASARQVFKGATHLSTVVNAGGMDVVVRRKLGAVTLREPRFLKEHEVLGAIEAAGVAVRAPRVMALGRSELGDEFTLHTYEGRGGPGHRAEHPERGLLQGEADDLVDQLHALSKVDTRPLDQHRGSGSFYRWLCVKLVRMVEELPAESARVASKLGLPGARWLSMALAPRDVTPRVKVLLHGDLNPWNLVRLGKRGDGHRLALIDWEMALIGDPLYDLVRHLHLSPAKPDIRQRMFRRWATVMENGHTRGWQRDQETYRQLEVVRSAYVDLDRLVTGEGLDAPNVRRAVGSYATTLSQALHYLGMGAAGQAALSNPYLVFALPRADDGDWGKKAAVSVLDRA